jgi:hypothetical protein
VVQKNPDVDDARWKTLFSAFERTATTPGASQTLANLSNIAPGATEDQLVRMTNEYTRASGQRPLDDSAAKNVKSLVDTGFYTTPQALSLVSGLSAYVRGGEAESLASKLTPPKPTGNPITDSNASDAWWKSVGYLKGQPSGAAHAMNAVAPELAADLRKGALGKRVSSADYRLWSSVDANTFTPRGLRAETEVQERERDRAVENSTVMDEMGMAKARANADKQAALQYRKNRAAGGDRSALNGELIDAAQGALPFNVEEVTRPMVNKATAPPVPQEPRRRPSGTAGDPIHIYSPNINP